MKLHVGVELIYHLREHRFIYGEIRSLTNPFEFSEGVNTSVDKEIEIPSPWDGVLTMTEIIEEALFGFIIDEGFPSS